MSCLLPSRRRTGVTLVEMTVIIVLSAVISGIIICGIAAAFRFDDQIAQHRVDQSNLVRLAGSLRSEIHQAMACRWDSDAKLLQLKLPDDRTIDYQLQNDRWDRSERDREGEPTLTPLGIGSDYQMACELDSVDQGELVEISVTNRPDDAPENADRPPRERGFRVVAMVGGDRVLLHN